MRQFKPVPDPPDRPYIIAHRGISARAPENTLASFELAAGTRGIDMIELDVRLSKDCEVIVLHDRTLQRTSTGNGPARNYLLEEIRSFDAGSWFHKSFSNQRIPTLEEVLRKFGSRMWVDIEIKSDPFHKEEPGLIEKAVLDVVSRCGMEKRVMFSSFNHKLLENIGKMGAGAATGVLYNFPNDFHRSPSDQAAKAGASVFVCAKRQLTTRMVENAHEHNIAVYVYTLNSTRDARRMMALGVDGIISDNADEIIDVVRKRETASLHS
jgi:glycerophosphoryl diester phosphodiesterase